MPYARCASRALLALSVISHMVLPQIILLFNLLLTYLKMSL